MTGEDKKVIAWFLWLGLAAVGFIVWRSYKEGRMKSQ